MKNRLIEKVLPLWHFYCGFDGEDTNTLQLTFSVLSGMLISATKIILGIFFGSLVWVFSGIYSICLSLARFLFLKDVVRDAPAAKRNTTVLQISIILMVSAFLFDLCAMFRQFQGTTGKPMAVWMVIPLSIYFVVSYVLAIVGLFRTKKNRALSFYAFRVICISGALMNMVLLQRIVLSVTSLPVEWIVAINSIFGYFIGGILLLTSLILMLRAIFAIRRI